MHSAATQAFCQQGAIVDDAAFEGHVPLNQLAAGAVEPVRRCPRLI